MEERASNVEVLLGCIKTSTRDYRKREVLFKIDLWELALRTLDKILVPNNPPNDNKNDMGNINMEGNKEDGLDNEDIQVGLHST